MSLTGVPAGGMSTFKRIRVLHVLEATLGGTRAYMSSIVDALDPDDFECAIVYSTLRADTGWPEVQSKAKRAGWQLFELDMRRAIHPPSDIRNARALRKILRAFSPDIVHGHSSKGGALARLAALGSVASAVYSPHGIATSLGRRYWGIEWLLSRMTNGFIAVSPSERLELIRQKLARSESIHVVHPVVEMPRVANQGAKVVPSEPLVVSVGRLVPGKRPFAFVELIGILRERGYNVRGCWVGDGEMREALEARITSSGLRPYVEITGWVNDPETFVSQASVVVSTTISESFGIVIAEALALGIPVVAPAIIGPIDILAGTLAGWLYRVGDVQHAATLIAEILDNPEDAYRMAEEGRQMVASNFSSSAMRTALSAAYLATGPSNKRMPACARSTSQPATNR